jgi:hypothetical protein
MATHAYILKAGKSLLASLLTFWALDVLVNVGGLQSLFASRDFIATPTDYFGLLIAVSQLALLATLMSWSTAPIAAILLRSKDVSKEAIALLGAIVIAFTVASGFRIAWDGALPALVLAAWSAIVAWPLFRRRVLRAPDGHDSLGATTAYLAYPSLVVGFAIHALADAARSDWIRAAVEVTAILLLAALAHTAKRVRYGRGSASQWFPILAGILLALGTSLSSSSYGRMLHEMPKRRESASPHLFLIVLDTLRADHLKRFGYSRNTMPALERWAERALVARRAVSPAGWTRPAHASIFSGMTVSQHGVHYGQDVFNTAAHEGIRWLPQRLSERGYYCLALSANPSALPDESLGFHRVLIPDRGGWNRSTLGGMADHRSPLTVRVSERLRWRTPYADARTVADATLRAGPPPSGPIFLFVNFMDAHSPYNPPAEALEALGIRPPHLFRRYSLHRQLTRRWLTLPSGKQQNLADLYDGELRWIDMHLSRLLEWIDATYGEDSTVVITSDHGEELGEAGEVGHEYGLSQRLLHVPLFIRSPRLRPGDFEEIVSLRRLYDFILLLGDGERVDPRILVEPDSGGVVSERYPSGHNVAASGSRYGRAWVSLIDERYKAVGPSGSGFDLYDIKVSGFDDEVPVSNEPVRGLLRGRVDSYWEGSRDRRGEVEERGAPSRDELQQLRALGYVE